MKTLPGLPGIYASEGKHGTTYYALVQNRNGKWLRRKVGTRKEGCSPAVAAARKIELQKQLSGGVDPDQNDKVTYGQAHKSYLKTRMSNGSDVTRDIDRHTLYLSRFDDTPISPRLLWQWMRSEYCAGKRPNYADSFDWIEGSVALSHPLLQPALRTNKAFEMLRTLRKSL